MSDQIPNVSAKKVAYLTDFVYICSRKTEIEVYIKFFSKNIASLAQLVEHDTLNVGVQGSSPWGSTENPSTGICGGVYLYKCS